MQQFSVLKSWGFANGMFAFERRLVWISLDTDLKTQNTLGNNFRI